MMPLHAATGVLRRALWAWVLAMGLGMLHTPSGAQASAPAVSAAAPSESARPAAVGTATPPTLEVFVREGCPHCAQAKQFLPELARQRPDLRIVVRAVDEDERARDALVSLSIAAGVWPPGVPTFAIDGRVLVGFGDAADSGAAVLALVDARGASEDSVRTRWFGTLSAAQLGLPLFTLALGLLDGFNPCAMWVLLFLLSLLVRLRDRRRMALIAGTFVLVSGAVYYAFMAAWLNVFLAVGLTTSVRVVLAVLALVIGALNVKDFFAWGRGPSLSIPQAAKPGLYARARAVLQARALSASLAAVAALAVVVNVVELLCTAGLPAVYTAVLAQQGLGPAAHYGYLGLYIAAYMADDALMVATAVLALGSRKLTEDAGRWLKLLSGGVMLALAGVMLLRPQWLF